MAASSAPYKSLAIISGASRGIGRAIALALADAVKEPSSMIPAPLRMVLIARSEDALRETARLVEQQCSGGSIQASCHPMDLSDLDALPGKLHSEVLGPLSKEQYDSCWLINNAGSLGPMGAATSLGDASTMNEFRSAVDFNITSACWVSSQFSKTFLEAPNSPLVRVVNISSLCGLEPFLNMSVYCAGKAGRELFHNVLAKENASASKEDDTKANDKETFKVLNYAPGACDTPMAAEVADFAASRGIKKDAPSADQVGLIRPEDTAKKLVRILRSDEYRSGAHIDYWDDV